MTEEDREFMRELLVRSERSERRHARTLNEMGRRLEAGTEQLRALTREIMDHREEGRSHTQALLRILDRLDGNGGASAA